MAIKVVEHNTGGGNADVIEGARESLLAASVSHPNVVACYKICTGGRWFGTAISKRTTSRISLQQCNVHSNVCNLHSVCCTVQECAHEKCLLGCMSALKPQEAYSGIWRISMMLDILYLSVVRSGIWRIVKMVAGVAVCLISDSNIPDSQLSRSRRGTPSVCVVPPRF